jgi:excisionase family DNA binding protein|tara:strand:+ start:1991 stop:2191 length:201 start_codon:yes stop_codon:yes gene_type:complete
MIGDTLINPDHWYTTKQVAEYFRIHERTVCSWIEQGKISAIQPGRKYLISGESVLDAVRRSKKVVY